MHLGQPKILDRDIRRNDDFEVNRPLKIIAAKVAAVDFRALAVCRITPRVCRRVRILQGRRCRSA